MNENASRLYEALAPAIIDCDENIQAVLKVRSKRVHNSSKQGLTQSVQIQSLSLQYSSSPSLSLPPFRSLSLEPVLVLHCKHVWYCHERPMSYINQSQKALGSHVERLSGALSTFSVNCEMPALLPYAEKLSKCRTRLTKVNQQVMQINDRLESIRTLVRQKELAKRNELQRQHNYQQQQLQQQERQQQQHLKQQQHAQTTPAIPIAAPISSAAAASETTQKSCSHNDVKETSVVVLSVPSQIPAIEASPAPTDTGMPPSSSSDRTKSGSATETLNALGDLLDWDERGM